MYGQFFNIDESAFSIAPNPKYLYLSKQHEEALAHLLYGVTRKGGFVCLTGDIGTGKTTICRCMFEQLPENTDIAFVINPKFSPMELLASICDELGVSYATDQPNIKECVKKLHNYLIQSHAEGKSTVLVVDEAQNLSTDAFEHIRALTNLETNEQKLLQIILIGQPELKSLLAKPELEQVNQRITARFHIGPLSLSETSQYIRHRLAVAGAKHRVFTDSNIKQIFAQTKGVPRLINILCDRVLLGAYTLGSAKITSKIITQSAEEVFDRKPSYGAIMPKALAASIAILFVSAAIVFAFQNITLNSISLEKIANFSLKSDDISNVNSGVDVKETKQFLAQNKMHTEKQKSNNANVENVYIEQTTVKLEEPKPIVSQQDEVKPKETGLKVIKSEEIKSAKKEISEKPASFMPQTEAKVTPKQKINENKKQESGASLQEDNKNNELQLTSYGKAYKQLFRIWGVSYSSDDVSPCKHALKNRLHCYRAAGSMKQVINLNRPVLLRSKDERFEPSFIILVSVEDNHAIVSQNEDYQLVAISEIEANWDGHFEMLWRPLQTGVSYIRPGHKGKVVSLLDQRLARLQGRQPLQNNPFEYSEDLVAQVRAFQLANNLPIDGVVGPITQMHFNNNSSETPLLIKYK